MESKLNLRIDDYTKSRLEELSSKNNISISHYLREILYDHVLDCDLHESIQKMKPSDVSIINDVFVSTVKTHSDYEKSFDFTHLLTWVFYKYLDPQCTDNDDGLLHIKEKVQAVIFESSFSPDLKIEFGKILNDLHRVLGEPENGYRQFTFSTRNQPLTFNFLMLINEIWSLKK